jgi:hypothetical protein
MCIVCGVFTLFAAVASQGARASPTAGEAERQLRFRLLAAFGDAAFQQDSIV